MEAIEKLTKLLEEQEVKVAPPALHVNRLDAFYENLSPEAKALVDKPYLKMVRPEGGELRFFTKLAQSPVKDWYPKRLAELFNDMVAAGKVEAFFAVGAFDCPTGELYMGPFMKKDVGPDQYAALFLFFFSKDTNEELGQFLGDSTVFVREGEMPNMPSWMGLGRTIELPRIK